MSYDNLADSLTRVGAQLKSRGQVLSGVGAAKLADSLGNALAKFEKALEAAIRQDSPDGRRLAELLTRDAAFWDSAQLGILAKGLGVKLSKAKSVSAETLRAKFVEATTDAGLLSEACEQVVLRRKIAEKPAPVCTSEESLRAELRRLGALPEAEIQLEIECNFTDEQTRALARAAGLKVTAKATKKKLLPDVVHYARRNYEHTAISW